MERAVARGWGSVGEQGEERQYADFAGPMFGVALTVLWVMVGASSHQIIYFGVINLSGWVITMGAAAFCCAVLGVFGVRGPLHYLRAVAGATASLGVALVSLTVNAFESNFILMVFGDVFSGIGLALSTLAILEVLHSLRTAGQRELVCLAALVVAALLFFLVIALGIGPLVSVCSLAPALSMLLLGNGCTSRSTVYVGSPAEMPGRSGRRALAPLCLPLGLSFMQGILLAIERGIEHPSEWSAVVGATTLAVVMAVLMIYGLLRRLTNRRLCSVLIPSLMILACVGYFALGSNGGAVSTSLCYSYYLLYLPYCFMKLSSFHDCRPNIQVIRCLLLSLSWFLGSAAGLIFLNSGLSILGSIWSGCCLVFLALDVVAWIKPSDVHDEGAGQVQGEGDGPAADRLTPSFPAADYIADLESSCVAFGDKYGLSPREVEILALIARGRSATSIASEKGITYNTVRSHVAHLYAKTGAHNREELMVLMEQSFASGDKDAAI